MKTGQRMKQSNLRENYQTEHNSVLNKEMFKRILLLTRKVLRSAVANKLIMNLNYLHLFSLKNCDYEEISFLNSLSKKKFE